PLPMHYLAKAVPALAGLRATQRFSLIIYIGVLMLSAMGVKQLIDRLSGRLQAVVCGTACTVFLIEVFPFTLPVSAANLYQVSAPDRARASYQRSLPAPLTVLHLPINYFREPYPISEAIYMLDSTAHWANVLNGFSGGVPNGFMDRMTMLNGLPDPSAAKLLL